MSIGEHRHYCVTLISKYKDLCGEKPIVSVTYEISLYIKVQVNLYIEREPFKVQPIKRP